MSAGQGRLLMVINGKAMARHWQILGVWGAGKAVGVDYRKAVA